MTGGGNDKQLVNTAYNAFRQLMESSEKVALRYHGPRNWICSSPFTVTIRTEPASLWPTPGLYPSVLETGATTRRPA